MRTNYHIQERHLAECVKQKVVSEEQVERILAVARTMAIAEGEAAPDLRWVTAVHAITAAAAVGVPALYMLRDRLYQLSGLELATTSAIACVVYLAAGFGLRRLGWGRVPGSILIAGGVLFTWGIGAGLYAAAHHSGFGDFGLDESYGSMSWSQLRMIRMKSYLAGDLAALSMAIVVGVRTRVAAIGASGAIAFVFLVMGAVEQHVLAHGEFFGERHAGPYLLALAVSLLIAGRFADKFWRGRHDAAFWLHLIGLMSLGFVACSRIHHAEVEGIAWTLAAAALAALGVRWDRRVYLFAAAAGLLGLPALSVGEAHGDSSAVSLALCVSAVFVALGAAWCRRHYAAAWTSNASRSIDRSVWE